MTTAGRTARGGTGSTVTIIHSGPSKLGVHAQDDVLLVRDAFKDLVDALGAQQDLLLLRVLVDVSPLRVQLQARAADAGLIAPTAAVALRASREGQWPRENSILHYTAQSNQL